MNLQELKSTIAAVESADNNIKKYNTLKGRELAIIPTDSDYFRNFQEYVKNNNIYYDGEKEKSPMYISKSDSHKIINILIDLQIDFSKKFRDYLSNIITI